MPPSKQEIANKYLLMVYKEEYRKCVNDLKNENLCLSLNGWSNIHNEPITYVTLIISTGHTYLLNTIDTSSQLHTAEYLQEIAKSSTKS